MKGLIASTFDWFTHPAKSEGTLFEWAAFLVIVLVVSFLWIQIHKEIER